jgi:hypothetical protein
MHFTHRFIFGDSLDLPQSPNRSCSTVYSTSLATGPSARCSSSSPRYFSAASPPSPHRPERNHPPPYPPSTPPSSSQSSRGAEAGAQKLPGTRTAAANGRSFSSPAYIGHEPAASGSGERGTYGTTTTPSASSPRQHPRRTSRRILFSESPGIKSVHLYLFRQSSLLFC